MSCAASLAAGQVRDFSFLVFGFVELALKRKLSFPVSRMWQRWVRPLSFGITEHRGPFAEAEVGGDHDAGAFVQFAEQMEQQRAA